MKTNSRSSSGLSASLAEAEAMVAEELLRRQAQTIISRPKPILNKADWPPDYVSVLAWRQVQLARFDSDPNIGLAAREYYRAGRCVEFITHWCDTYDPRRAQSLDRVDGARMTHMPFIPFKRQVELIEFIFACLAAEAPGLVEKSRDMGATWICCAISVYLFLFWPGAAVGWGSRKQELVDELGNPDSIFEKMRMLLRRLPPVFLPKGFSDRYMPFMKIINPETGAVIAGEIGDNIGRGGRSLVYFKDEASHYERPEKIEAALADNTRVPIDISSVNGPGNVFHRKREAGVLWEPDRSAVQDATNVFIMDWSDHPEKTPEWYERRRRRAVNEGLRHVFAQEVMRDYLAAVEGVIIDPEHVAAAIDAHKKIEGLDDGGWTGALDVADGGIDANALATRKGVVLRSLAEWAARDTGVTARHAIAQCAAIGAPIDLYYDCVGVGSSVKAEANRLRTDPEVKFPSGLSILPWDAGAKALHPEKNVIPGDRKSPLNKDFFENIKAQGWWQLARRFERTWRAITEGAEFDPGELISLPSDLPNLRQLQKELSQPTMGQSGRLRLLVNKTPNGTKSPNLGDAVMMAFWPARARKPMTISRAEVLKVMRTHRR